MSALLVEDLVVTDVTTGDHAWHRSVTIQLDPDVSELITVTVVRRPTVPVLEARHLVRAGLDPELVDDEAFATYWRALLSGDHADTWDLLPAERSRVAAAALAGRVWSTRPRGTEPQSPVSVCWHRRLARTDVVVRAAA